MSKQIFCEAVFETDVLPSKLLNFGVKLASDESSMYAESKYLKIIVFKQTLIITKFAN